MFGCIFSAVQAYTVVKFQSGRVIMDYKKEIIELIDKINDDSLLEFFYRFIARVLKNRGD